MSSRHTRTDLDLQKLHDLGINTKLARQLRAEEWADIERALERRLKKLRRRNFQAFCEAVDIPGTPPNKVLWPHHELLCQVCQRMVEGKLRRVFFFLPPGSAKSSYGSVAFPAFYMGYKARSSVIVLSYGSDLALKFGRRTRQLVKSPEYQDIFDADVKRGVSAVDDWQLDNESAFMTNGLLGGVTGNRADGLIIDDPVRGAKDADSAAFSKSTFDAYLFDARTRLKPGAWQLIIQTRWSGTDLSGSILPDDYDGRSGFVKCKDGHQWFVVNVPMEAWRADDPLGRPPGQMLYELHPGGDQLFDADEIASVKNAPHTQRVWQALYQQRPSSEEGLYFKTSWFKRYDRLPQHLRYYMASDFALTEDDGDWTVHIIFGVDHVGNIYVVDVWRQRVTSDVSTEAALQLIRSYEPLNWAVDRDSINLSIGPFVRRRMLETNTFCAIEEMPMGRQDKLMRARSFQARAAQGLIYIPTHAEWLGDFLNELALFPAGKNDDQVDSCGLMGRLLDTVAEAYVPEDVLPDHTRDYGDDDVGGAEDWKTA